MRERKPTPLSPEASQKVFDSFRAVIGLSQDEMDFLKHYLDAEEFQNLLQFPEEPTKNLDPLKNTMIRLLLLGDALRAQKPVDTKTIEICRSIISKFKKFGVKDDQVPF